MLGCVRGGEVGVNVLSVWYIFSLVPYNNLFRLILCIFFFVAQGLVANQWQRKTHRHFCLTSWVASHCFGYVCQPIHSGRRNENMSSMCFIRMVRGFMEQIYYDILHIKKKIKFLLQNNKALGTGLHIKENPASSWLAMSFSHTLTAYPTDQ